MQTPSNQRLALSLQIERAFRTRIQTGRKKEVIEAIAGKGDGKMNAELCQG